MVFKNVLNKKISQTQTQICLKRTLSVFCDANLDSVCSVLRFVVFSFMVFPLVAF